MPSVDQVSAALCRPHQFGRESSITIRVLGRQSLVKIATSIEVVSVVFCAPSQNGLHDLDEMRVLMQEMVPKRVHAIAGASANAVACDRCRSRPFPSWPSIDGAVVEKQRAEDDL